MSLLAASALSFGCSRPIAPSAAADARTTTAATPADSKPLAYDDEPLSGKATTDAKLPEAPRARPVVVPESETPASLEARYFSPGIKAEDRSGIIQDLGSLGTAQAAEALGRIFQNEKRLEQKGEALQVVCDLSDETCRDQKFATLQKAVAPNVSQVIRLGALQSMADFEDPRVRAALEALRSDRDVEVRKMVADILKDLAP